MATEPSLHLLGQVRARVVHDLVDREIGWGRTVEGRKEREELRGPMSIVELGHHRGVEHVQRGESVEGSVTNIVVGTSLGEAGPRGSTA